MLELRENRNRTGNENEMEHTNKGSEILNSREAKTVEVQVAVVTYTCNFRSASWMIALTK